MLALQRLRRRRRGPHLPLLAPAHAPARPLLPRRDAVAEPDRPRDGRRGSGGGGRRGGGRGLHGALPDRGRPRARRRGRAGGAQPLRQARRPLALPRRAVNPRPLSPGARTGLAGPTGTGKRWLPRIFRTPNGAADAVERRHLALCPSGLSPTGRQRYAGATFSGRHSGGGASALPLTGQDTPPMK